jgi:hypothetical protein
VAQLAELKTAIEHERTLRPLSVSFIFIGRIINNSGEIRTRARQRWGSLLL